MIPIPLTTVLATLLPMATSGVLRLPHVTVTYQGIDAAQAKALAETASAAREIYAGEFGFDMPDKVLFSVKCGPDEPTRLYNDGEASIFLSLPGQEKLAKPATSGVFNLYGICHELGHMAMYRTLKDRAWLSSSAAESWAHYAGSLVVDRVFAAKGESLWPDPYDYRQDGTARLRKEIAASQPSTDAQAASWQELEGIVGLKGLPKVFVAWQAANANPADPGDALLSAAVKAAPDKKDALTTWWKAALPLFVEKRAASSFKVVRIPASQLTGKPIVLAFDDEASEGKRSIAGGGHARKFSAPTSEGWYIRAVSVYGSRYGYPQPPPNTFDVALCDEAMKTIAVWKKPYGTFERGELKWVRMEVPPTRVPKTFFICLAFNPTGQRGVYVAFDTSTHGNSLVATPGKPGTPLAEGDWMIRVELDQPKDASPLMPK
jgi:hypothetical protein